MTSKRGQSHIKLEADKDNWLDPKVYHRIKREEIDETIKDILRNDEQERLTDFCYAILRGRGDEWKEQ